MQLNTRLNNTINNKTLELISNELTDCFEKYRDDDEVLVARVKDKPIVVYITACCGDFDIFTLIPPDDDYADSYWEISAKCLDLDMNIMSDICKILDKYKSLKN